MGSRGENLFCLFLSFIFIEAIININLTMVISTSDSEVWWNASRLANLMMNQFDVVSIFLNGPAVEYKSDDYDQFPLAELAKTFVLGEGVLLA